MIPVGMRSCFLQDVPGMVKMFRETVHLVCKQDYSQEQLQAWAPESVDQLRWIKKIQEQDSIAAEVNNELVGFCTWEREGFIDLLYVHHAYQRMGIGSVLYSHAELTLRLSGVKYIQTHSSLTALPFFKRHGFSTVMKQQLQIAGVVIPNVVLEKNLI